MTDAPQPRVGVIMGSDSDWSVMEDAAQALVEFDVPFEVGVVSAHRTPGRMFDYAQSAAGRGIEVIIAGAGGAAHLPGMVASATPLPVIGVPVPLAKLDGLDSLLSIVQCGNVPPGPHTGCRTPSGPTDGVDMTMTSRTTIKRRGMSRVRGGTSHAKRRGRVRP